MPMSRLLEPLALMLLPMLASAGEILPFSAEALARLQKAGGPVLVEVHADWCPTCLRQKPVVESLVKTPKYLAYTVLQLDFDAQEAERKTLHASRQSTLIVYRGSEEKARQTGVTSAEGIAQLLDAGLKAKP